MVDATEQRMREVLAAQKAANIRDGAPSAELRIERLDRCIGLLKKHEKAIEEALNADFGARSPEAAPPSPTSPARSARSQHAKANLTKWMRPEKRKTSPALLGLFGRQGRGALPAEGRGRRSSARGTSR